MYRIPFFSLLATGWILGISSGVYMQGGFSDACPHKSPLAVQSTTIKHWTGIKRL